MYQIEEIVVYPTHGIGTIENIVEKSAGNGQKKKSYYIINIDSSGVKIMMPVENAKKVGIREISNPRKITKALKIIKQESSVSSNEHWNRRHKEYMVKIKTGCILDMAEVFRDLSTLQNSKSLSFGEKKILENVENLLASEIAAAKKIESVDAKKMLAKAVSAPRQN